MAESSAPLFSFVSTALHPGTFHVVRFRGREGLSSLYRFEILLLSEDSEIDLGLVLSSAATFTIHAADGEQESPYHGILEGFQQMHRVGDYALYRAVLVPRLWRLTLTSHNQIFLGQTPKEIIGDCLKDGGLLESDLDMRIEGKNDPWGYVCQYNESHYHFFARWAERYGYYYFFDQSGSTEKLVLTDTHMSHEPLRGQPVLDYTDMSGLDALEAGHVVKDFTMSVSPLPQKVKLKSYNYEKPDLDLQVEQEVDAQGAGEVYVYGQEFLTLEDGRKLAVLRAQELQCRSRVFNGISNIAFMTPGYTFTLRGHYRSDCNRDYLITEVEHEGAQESWLTSGLGVSLSGSEDRPSYRNSFQCIPSTVQYRPSRSTTAPKIAGTLHAKIDAAGSGEYAELDAQGRYKVIMPFDLSGRSGGKASIWLRKAEPYAGSNHGMHFPLHKGTEVMVAFIDGDPNRPFIQSAMANPSTPSVVTDATQTQSRITTAGGNRLHFEDSEGHQSMTLSTPAAGAFIKMGSASGGEDDSSDSGSDGTDSDDLDKKVDELSEKVEDLEKEVDGGESKEWVLGIHIKTSEKVKVEAGSLAKFVRGNEATLIAGATEEVVFGGDNSTVLGVKLELTGGLVTDIVLGGIIEVHHPEKWEIAPVKTEIHELKESIEGIETSLHQQSTKIGDLRTDVQNSTAFIVNEHAALENQVTQLQNQVDELGNLKQELRTEISQTYATQEQLAATKSEVTASIEKVQGDVSEVQGTVNEVAGAVDATLGEVSRIAGEVSDVTATTNIIAGEMGFL